MDTHMKTNMEPETPVWKGESSSKPHFFGFHVSFWGSIEQQAIPESFSYNHELLSQIKWIKGSIAPFWQDGPPATNGVK